MGIPPPLESYRWLCHVYAALPVEMWTRRLNIYKPAAETPLVCQCDYDWFYKSNEVTRVGAMLVTVMWLLNYKSNALHYSVTDKSNIITVTRYFVGYVCRLLFYLAALTVMTCIYSIFIYCWPFIYFLSYNPVLTGWNRSHKINPVFKSRPQPCVITGGSYNLITISFQGHVPHPSPNTHTHCGTR